MEPSKRGRGRARGQQGAPNSTRPTQQFQRPPQLIRGPSPQANRGPPPPQPNRGPPPQQSQGPRLAQTLQLRPPGSRPSGPRPSGPKPSGSSSVEQVTSGFKNLAAGDAPLAIGRGAVRGRQIIETPYYRTARPESSKTNSGKQGSGGQGIQLLSNYFPITTYTNWTLYQYRVDFNPIQDRINIQRGLLSAHRNVLGAYIFDGTMLFSSTKYNLETLELTSKRTSDDQIVIVTVKFTSVIEKGDPVCIQIFNLLLRRCLQHLNLKLVGRNYYDADAAISVPKYKLQLWPGYETTIGMFDSGLLLRSEISTKVMREENVLDYLIECSKGKNYDPNWMLKFKIGIIGSVVLTRYNNQTYKIDDIDDQASTNSSFRKKDGSSITYKDYYFQKYGIRLSNTYQPMLVSKKKKSFRIEGEESELVYLVPELCSLTGINESMRKNRYLMEDLSIHTRLGPSERIDRYTRFINRVLQTPESAESLTQWNLTLSNNLINIPGRVLAQEELQGFGHKYKAGPLADWSVNLRSDPMFSSAQMKNWIILIPSASRHEVKAFVFGLFKVAKGMQFNLTHPEIEEVSDQNIRSYVTKLDIIINQKNPPFILCVIPPNREDIYICIKKQLCVDRAVPSQVVLTKQLSRVNLSVCTKILIQINCKLGGAPWRVVIPEKKMMIVGFDVCHDKKNRNRSWGALVATMNDSHTTYFNCVQPHESGQELSSYFKMSIAKALNKYKIINKCLPNSIIIYRDGVGDGQLSYVHKTEVNMIKETCKEFYGEKKVGLAFIVVKKRISSRFFCKTENGVTNPPPGTIVDTTITDPTMYDFYLVSQNVNRGTVTPTHYNVIVDNLSETTSIQITPTIMQKLTFKLTHMYYNWAGTVSVPAPCQLAHKLAFLTGTALGSAPNPGLEDLLFFL